MALGTLGLLVEAEPHTRWPQGYEVNSCCKWLYIELWKLSFEHINYVEI